MNKTEKKLERLNLEYDANKTLTITFIVLLLTTVIGNQTITTPLINLGLSMLIFVLIIASITSSIRLGRAYNELHNMFK